MTEFEPIEVLAPATTANLGPGFDCLGMALDLWNRLEVLPAVVHRKGMRGLKFPARERMSWPRTRAT